MGSKSQFYENEGPKYRFGGKKRGSKRSMPTSKEGGDLKSRAYTYHGHYMEHPPPPPRDPVHPGMYNGEDEMNRCKWMHSL